MVLEHATLLTAEPPEVLEPSVSITQVKGLPMLMRHDGYRLCGDNLDKIIHRRHMRSDRGNISMHYFLPYAVKNRINFGDMSDDIPDNSGISRSDLTAVAKSLLPTELDDAILKRNISTLIERVLCKNLDFFRSTFHDIVEWHIHHKYYDQMSSKSEVVSGCIHIIAVYIVV